LVGAPIDPRWLIVCSPRWAGTARCVEPSGSALVPAPPTERASGGFIAAGYRCARLMRCATPPVIRAAPSPRLEARYREETGTPSLKIRHNGVLGYFIEVPARHADRLMAPDSGFTHRQTMAGAVRLQCLGAARGSQPHRRSRPGTRLRQKKRISTTWWTRAPSPRAEAIAATAAALARVDVSAGQAERAARAAGACPTFARIPRW